MMTFFLGIKNWIIGIGAALLLLLSAIFLARSGGKKVAIAEQKVKNAEQRATNIETRAAADETTQQLPAAAADPQKVADADPASSAGRLRDDGWLR